MRALPHDLFRKLLPLQAISISDMLNQLKDFMEKWIPQFEADNRSYLCVAIGCTGGHHRSVYLAESLAEYFLQQGKHVIINHRDI